MPAVLVVAGELAREQCSSSRLRAASSSDWARPTASADAAPVTSGPPRNMRIAPRYMGWRTQAYTPVETTRCPRSVCTRTRADPNVLSANERNRSSHDPASSASPISSAARGSRGVQWKRRASSGISTIQATKPTVSRYTMIRSRRLWPPVPGMR